jgi:exodeoxyribonuclease VII small subunit
MTKKKDDIENMSFEEALNLLRKHAERLESEDLDLENALKGYEEAVRLASKCLEHLKEAEEKVKVISQNASGKLVFEDFDSQG